MVTVHSTQDRLIVSVNCVIFDFRMKYFAKKDKIVSKLALELIHSIHLPQLNECVRNAPVADDGSKPFMKRLKCNGVSRETSSDDATRRNPSRRQSSSHTVSFSVLSEELSLIAIVMTSKLCFVYRLTDWQQIDSSPISTDKKPTACLFDVDGKYLIISDRAGFVRRFRIDGQSETSKNGEVLLGHISMVLDVKLSEDNRLILSGDRDEQLRVSRYPQTFLINCFCLGHTSFVKSIYTFANIALSAGGDKTIRVWNIETAENILVHPLMSNESVRCIRCVKSDEGSIKIGVIFEKSSFMQILKFDVLQTCFHDLFYLDATDDILDLSFVNQEFIVCCSRSFIKYVFIVGDAQLITVENIDNAVVSNLRSAEIESPYSSKKTGFGYVDEYMERKKGRSQKGVR